MAISNRISIDGKQYRVLAGDYSRAVEPPKTVRPGVLGNTIVSMGPGEATRPTRAVLHVPFEPSLPWGSLLDLEAAAQKMSVSYTDHITGDASKWGSGTFDITLLKLEVLHKGGAPMPDPGYNVLVEWVRINA